MTSWRVEIELMGLAGILRREVAPVNKQMQKSNWFEERKT